MIPENIDTQIQLGSKDTENEDNKTDSIYKKGK